MNLTRGWKMEIIDFSSHIIPPNVGKILMKKPYFGPASAGGKYYHLYPPENADPNVRISLMERYGIRMQLLSQTTPVLLGFNAQEASEICRLSNDYIYELCSRYPDRFVGCAIISLLDVDAALEELDRTIGEMGFRCVTISTNQNGVGLDSPAYFPFYERIVKYDVPIFLHPTHWEGYSLMGLDAGWRGLFIFGWPFDTTQAVWRLICGGILERFSSLKIVTHHLGGMLPYYYRRVTTYWRSMVLRSFPELREKLRKPIESYFKNIYGDTAINGGPIESYICGYAFFGAERMLFGTDYPFGDEITNIGDNINCVRTMPISDVEKSLILGENAKRLLRIKT